MPDDHGAPAQPGRSELNEAMLETAFLFGGNAAYIEELAARHAKDPNSVDPSWRAFFAEVGDAREAATRAAEGPSWKRADWPPVEHSDTLAALTCDNRLDAELAPAAAKVATTITQTRPELSEEGVRLATLDSIRALMMIRAYRIRGHLAAELDPLRLAGFGDQPELDPETYGFGADGLDRPVFIDGVLGLETATVREMLDILKRTYCSTLGVEFMHISSPEEKAWLQARIEGPDKGVSFTAEGKKAILYKLIETEAFERFLHKRYPGTKIGRAHV